MDNLHPMSEKPTRMKQNIILYGAEGYAADVVAHIDEDGVYTPSTRGAQKWTWFSEELCDVYKGWRYLHEKIEVNWTREWPTEPGRYWFYGYPYGKQKTEMGLGDKTPSLHLVNADKTSNSMVYVMDGQFLFRDSKIIGMFCKAELPELPNLEE